MAKATKVPGKITENKLSTVIDKEQPAEIPFTDTFKEMHRQYQNGNELLRQQYKDKLWQKVITNLSKNKEELVKIFLQITDSTITVAEAAILELKPYYYNDAASACQYVLKIAEDGTSKTEAHKRLNIIQNNIVKLCGANPDALKSITGQADVDRLCHKGELQTLRDLTRKSLKEIEEAKEKDEKLHINNTATLFKTIASGMEQYLAGLYREAEGVLGQAPCKYAVIGFGSMALRQTTPYSDLECAILTENDNYRQSGDHLIQNYFKNLSHLVHFMIINLGETIIPTSRYGFDLSEFIPQAVNFDLGGKTPLGRIELDKPYDLVQTVEGMLRYLRNEEQKTEHMDKNLPNILQKTCFVHGEKGLAGEYQSQAEEFLLQIGESGRPNCEVRAVKVLSEGVVEFNYTKVSPSSKEIKGDLELFGFKPYEAEGKLFDVKQEIYRLPDRLVYYLGLIHGVQGDGSWDTLDKLQSLGKISLDGAGNLKKALTFATNLRLKTYDHYGYQKETMDFSKSYKQNQTEPEELIEAISDTFRLKREDLKPDGVLFEYYKTVVPLHTKLGEFCTTKDIENKYNLFAKEVFYSNHPGTIATIHLRLLQYEEALDQQLLELEELKAIFGLEHPHVATSLSNVGTTYGELGQYEEALEYQLKALELRKKILGQEHPDVATSLNNVGVAYGKLGQYEVALEHLQKALEIRQKCFNDNHPLIADCKKHIAWNCQKLGKYDEALIGVEEALIVFKNKDQQKDVTKCEKLLEKILKNQQSLNTTSITKSEELLNKADGIIRLVSYNVTADYFDEEDKTEDGHHHWQFRATFVIKLLSAVYPDIICLQELSPNQALELYEYFGKRLGYSSIFLSQTPSEVKVGAIAHGSEISDWCGKNIGTPLVGTFISKACKFLEVGKFWLNEEPDVVPINTDRGETDKGFGNMNTYRAVLWTKVQIDDSKVLFVFNRVMMELPLAGVLNEQQNKEGYYASDHALVGIDLFWS